MITPITIIIYCNYTRSDQNLLNFFSLLSKSLLLEHGLGNPLLEAYCRMDPWMVHYSPQGASCLNKFRYIDVYSEFLSHIGKGHRGKHYYF